MDQEQSANQPASQPVGIFAVAAAVNNMLDDVTELLTHILLPDRSVWHVR